MLSQNPLLNFRDPTSKGKERRRKREKKGRKRNGEERGQEKR